MRLFCITLEVISISALKLLAQTCSLILCIAFIVASCIGMRAAKAAPQWKISDLPFGNGQLFAIAFLHHAV